MKRHRSDCDQQYAATSRRGTGGALGLGDRQACTGNGSAAAVRRRAGCGTLLAAAVLATATGCSGASDGPTRLDNVSATAEVTASASASASASVSVGTGSEPTTTPPPPTPEPPVLGPARPFTTTLGAGLRNGRTRIERSLGCSAGSDADYWHFSSEAPLPVGVITGPQSTLPGDARVAADVHSPFHAVRVAPEPVPGPTDDSAFLLPGASRVALSNNRGTVKMGLSSGTCERTGRAVDFDGVTARTGDRPGSWTITSSTGSYRQAQGSGHFDLEADVSPGADNPWSLAVRGAVAVIQPKLDVQVVETFWGRDGVDYVKRHVGVVYQVTNVGAGDSFDVLLTQASSPTPGASLVAIIIHGDNVLIDGNTPVGQFPRTLGDLASGESARIVLTWQLPLPAGDPPCGLVILSCQIDTELTFALPDALDVATTPEFGRTVTAPDLPPPA